MSRPDRVDRRCESCGQRNHATDACPLQKKFKKWFDKEIVPGLLYRKPWKMSKVTSEREGIKRRRRKSEWKNRKQRARKNKWRQGPTVSKQCAYQAEISKLVSYLNRVNEVGVDEFAMMCREIPEGFDGTTFLGDTGASTHMIGVNDGLYDCRDIDETVVIGDGKPMRATRIGKLKRTVYQKNGMTQDIILDDVKLVPGLDMPLFAVLKALDQGWKISNEGVFLTLRKDGVSITFNRLMRTKNGKLVGVALLPRDGRSSKKEMAMPVQETTEKPNKVWNINRMHRVYNHAGEDALRRTAKACGWKLTGKMEKCISCLEGNARKKGVAKFTDTKSETPGERIFIDTTSISSARAASVSRSDW